ncbi:unnamed protein product [Somion occarium]|uniref:MARVEL domain-containing protein n=1 Tax=Somion occarium TaxID=3059160 RepID=A0ABP1ED03_9APHY
MVVVSPPLNSTDDSTSSSFHATDGPDTSAGITGGIVVAILALSMGYSVALYFLYRYSEHHPKDLNKVPGVKFQKFIPLVYVFLISSCLVEASISMWLLAQYAHTRSFPNVGTRDGIRLSLFTAIWTLLCSTAYLVLFAHPALSNHPVASIGSQALWTLATWCFWVACVAVLNQSLPLADADDPCAGAVYCGQVRADFGVAIIEMLVLTASMFALTWLLWRNYRRPSTRRF